MMTTEVMWGNDHLNQPETEAKIEQRVIDLTEGQKQNQAVLEIAAMLHKAETEVHYLKQRVAELEDLLKSK